MSFVCAFFPKKECYSVIHHLILTCFSSVMVRRGGCLGGVVVVAVLLLAVGASMSENPSDSLSASPASPELMRVCRCSGELEEAEKEDAEEGEEHSGR